MVMLRTQGSRCRAALNIEVMVALGLLTTAMIPLAYGFLTEIKLARQYYHDAVAMQLVDGELEVLAAGEWKAYGEGEHILSVAAPSRTTLPPGKFFLARRAALIRIEWRPEKHGRRMSRELKIPEDRRETP